jgi:hypothetical protein
MYSLRAVSKPISVGIVPRLGPKSTLIVSTSVGYVNGPQVNGSGGRGVGDRVGGRVAPGVGGVVGCGVGAGVGPGVGWVVGAGVGAGVSGLSVG